MPDTEALKETVYREYYGKVFGYVRSKIGNTSEAEDIAADVFLKVYENLDHYDSEKSSLSTWVFTIMRNVLTDRFRTRRIIEEIPETLSDGYSVEEEVCDNETLTQLAAALETLETRERDLIILRYYREVPLKDIAMRLGISYAYAKVVQKTALKKLEKILQNQ